MTNELDELCRAQPDAARVILSRHALRIASGLGCKWERFPASTEANNALLSYLRCLLSASCLVNRFDDDALYATFSASFGIANSRMTSKSNGILSATFEKAATACNLSNRDDLAHLSHALQTGANYDNGISDDIATARAHGSAGFDSLPLIDGRYVGSRSQHGFEVFVGRLTPKYLITGFWEDWYKAQWDGTFRDWDLAIEVATLPNDLWEGEDALARVAEAIRAIEARFRTRVSTPLVRNTDDTAFVLAQEPPLPDELLEYIKERVGGALQTALDTGGSNGFDESCPEARAVSHALQSENASAIAGLLNDTSLMFQKNLGDLYPEDRPLIALQVAAFSAAEEICENDEVARRRCLRASQFYLRANP